MRQHVPDPTQQERVTKSHISSQNAIQLLPATPSPSLIQRLQDLPASLRSNQILAFQRTAGNRAVQNFLPTSGGTRPAPPPVAPIQQARPAPVIQRKRDTSTGDPLSMGPKSEEHYKESKTRGDKLRLLLDAWKIRQAENESLPPLEKRKRPKETTKSKIEGMGYKTLAGYTGKDNNIKLATGRETGQPKSEELLSKSYPSPYTNYYNPDTQDFTAAWNMRDSDDYSGKDKAPNNSEIIWYQLRRALKMHALSQKTGSTGIKTFSSAMPFPPLKPSIAGKLKSIRRDTIINEDTKDTIYWCDLGLEVNNSTLDKKGVTQVDDDFWALLGTPNGNSAAWLLMQHGHKLGAKDIDKITYESDGLTIEYKY